jgi:two-component system, NtrC family, response regulator AtoC
MTHKTKKIFIVEDDDLLSLVLSEGFRKEGYDITRDPGLKDVVKSLEESRPDLLLLDVNLPHNSGLQILEDLRKKNVLCPVIMITGDDSAETAVTALKLGAYDYITKPFEMEKLKIIVRNALEAEELKKTVEHLRDDALTNTLIGKSPLMIKLIEEIKKIGSQRVLNVLVMGESGTGKELVSRAIHNASPSCLNPFVAINCAALPLGLLESELFGHEKGAFTDAKMQKKGLFEEADRGTLVLDEIGDMDLSLQAKLLRVLENRTIRRIGGAKEIPFDVMVIATTNRDLNALQKENKFRQDLFYRLSMFSLRVPPLRERREDIPILAEFFLAQCKNEFRKENIKVSPAAMEVLLNYGWPGNVRELKSLFAKVCLLEETAIIEPEHIYRRLEVSSEQRLPVTTLPDESLSLNEMEKKLIQETLTKAKGNMTKAAKLLNITYDTLRYRLKKFDIRY